MEKPSIVPPLNRRFQAIAAHIPNLRKIWRMNQREFDTQTSSLGVSHDNREVKEIRVYRKRTMTDGGYIASVYLVIANFEDNHFGTRNSLTSTDL
jgi:hypothetical protein